MFKKILYIGFGLCLFASQMVDADEVFQLEYLSQNQLVVNILTEDITGFSIRLNAPQESYTFDYTEGGEINLELDLSNLKSPVEEFTITAIAYQGLTPHFEQVLASPHHLVRGDNAYPVGQCTWGVKEMATWVPNNLGNAKDWLVSAVHYGFEIGREPRVGAVAVWPKDGVIDGQVYGHVAYVSAVENDHMIQVIESNYAGNQYLANFRGWFNPQDSIWGGDVLYIYSSQT